MEKEKEKEKEYIVSARKYRPSTFKAVVGQKALTATLKSAVDSGRLAQAYLFCGPRGVGKTSCARIFAKTINCLHPTTDGEACGECESCKSIDRGNSYNLIELDAASNNGVNEIRNLNEQVFTPPQVGKYRVFIIDEVHMLSNQAFNAFLKTLEEPPKYVVFILATTEKHKVIPTILSRCQIYDFKRITIQDMVEHLQYVAKCEGIHVEVPALNVIARKAEGAMRDALSIFDQVAASTQGNITYKATIENLNVLDYDYFFRLVDSFRECDAQGALLAFNDVREKGFDPLFFINGLASHVRDLMVAADARTLPLLEAAEDIAPRYSEQAKTLPLQWYYAAMKLLNDCDVAYRTATSKQFLVELTLIRLSQLLKPQTPPFDQVDFVPPLRKIESTPHPASAAPVNGESTVASASPLSAQSVQASSTAAPEAAAESVATSRQTPADASVKGVSSQSRQNPVASATRRVGSLRLSDMKKSVDSEGLGPRREKREEPVTPELFAAAWEKFAIGHPEKRIMVSAMRTARPVQTAPCEFRVEVNHPAEIQSFDIDLGKLMEFLREELRNDSLTIKVELAAQSMEKTNLPPQEFLKKAVAENPRLAKFLGNVEVEIG